MARCAAGLALMAAFNWTHPRTRTAYELTVCEELSSPDGAITFVAASGDGDGPFPLTLQKRLEANSGDDNVLGNLTKKAVLSAPTDVMGNALLGIHGLLGSHQGRQRRCCCGKTGGSPPPSPHGEDPLERERPAVAALNGGFGEQG